MWFSLYLHCLWDIVLPESVACCICQFEKHLSHYLFRNYFCPILSHSFCLILGLCYMFGLFAISHVSLRLFSVFLMFFTPSASVWISYEWLIVAQSCPTVATPWTVAHQSLCPWNSPGRNTHHGRVACHFLLQDWISYTDFFSLHLIWYQTHVLSS